MYPYKKCIQTFSPPYGDGTYTTMMNLMKKKFSPPYGDGTEWFEDIYSWSEFSPPYGDKLKSMKKVYVSENVMLPSPCGDKLKYDYHSKGV